MSRRAREPFRELIPKYALKTRYEEVADLASYAFKLNVEDRTWLNKFAKEWISASLEKGEDGEYLPTNFHNTPELRSIIWARNNARNGDIFTKEKAMGTMNYIEDMLMIKSKQFEDEKIVVINEDSDNLYDMFEEKEVTLETILSDH